ncbi:MAG: radical SAM protein [bacterium]|nr:radical SAM protein [bacterium]
MKISRCSTRPVLVPCGLENFEFQIDPYVGCEHLCHYCYVLDQAETDWSEEVLVHADIAGQLVVELEGIPAQTIYMGYHSDPYQPCESEQRQTRRVLELLLERGFSASILTKSDLVLRDMDILKQMPDANVSVSVAFSDDRIRQLFEAGTIETERRIDGLRQVRDAGIRTSAMLCPIIPHLTDPMPLLGALAPVAGRIRVYRLSVLMPTQRCWTNVQEILARHFVDLREDVESTVLDQEHPFWTKLRGDLQAAKEEMGLDLRIHV